MKVLKVQNCKSTEPVLVTDCFVGEGYLQGDSRQRSGPESVQ